MKPVGMGVVGAGSIGIRAALMHLSLPDVQDRVYLAAVCDPVPGRAQAAAEKYGVLAAYETYEELLADPQVDAITVCSPIGLHFDQGMMAVAAGKHMHFNKTMTVTSQEADTLMAAAEKKGIHIVASPGMMIHPHNQRLRRAVLEGRLGKLAWAIAGTSAGSGIYHLTEGVRQGDDLLSNINPAWYFRKPGGGPQYDVTVYCLHNLTGILGPAKRVSAMSGIVLPEREFHGEMLPCDQDDNTHLLIDFGDAFYAFIYGSAAGSVMSHGFQPSIFGMAGSIAGTSFGDLELKLPDDHQPHVIDEHAKLGENHVYEDMMQLVDWIRGAKPSIASAEHARHVIEIIEAGYRAAETGETQTLRTTFEALPLDALADWPEEK